LPNTVCRQLLAWQKQLGKIGTWSFRVGDFHHPLLKKTLTPSKKKFLKLLDVKHDTRCKRFLSEAKVKQKKNEYSFVITLQKRLSANTTNILSADFSHESLFANFM
jgi:hypothetical protein